MKKLKKLLIWLLVAGLLGFSAFYAVNFYVITVTASKITAKVDDIPTEEPPRIGIVFGASARNGTPSDVLYDRVATAVELYKAGRVKKLLMSGDNPNSYYDEPTTMKATAVKLGVPETDIVMDFAGRRTYDTCWRAKNIFGVDRAVLVTQQFHMPRAVYLCSNLGVDSVGLTADPRIYFGEGNFRFREYFAVASAWFESNIYSFAPIGGEKEPIKQ